MTRHPAALGSPRQHCVLSLAAALVATMALAGSARADVLLVDPASPIGFQQIQPAVDVALPNDVILVHPLADPEAVYDPFVISGKQIAVCGTIEQGSVRVAGIQVGDTPDGAVVMLCQLDVIAPPDTPGVVIGANAGWVRLQRLNVYGGAGSATGPAAGMIVNPTSSLIVTYCNIYGGDATPGAGLPNGARALQVTSTHITVRGGQLRGGRGADSPVVGRGNGGNGGTACWTFGGNVFVSHVVATGGDGGLAGCPSDGSCLCGIAGTGGDAIEMNGSILILENNTLNPGNPTEGQCGPSGVAGVALDTVGGAIQQLPSYSPHDYWMSAPLQTPVFAFFHYQGEENEAIYISAGTIGSHKYFSKYDGDVYVGVADLLDFYFLRILDYTGFHETTHPVPFGDMTSGMAYTQGFFLKDGKLKTGPLSLFIYIGYGP
jgi:hypothetical protein